MKPDSLGSIPVMHMSKRNNNFEIKYNEKKFISILFRKELTHFKRISIKTSTFVTRIMLIHKD